MQLAGFASNRSHNIDEETLQGKVQRSQGAAGNPRNAAHYMSIIQSDGRVCALIALRGKFDSRRGDRSRGYDGALRPQMPFIHLFIKGLTAQTCTRSLEPAQTRQSRLLPRNSPFFF
jgi:hypothetical protein